MSGCCSDAASRISRRNRSTDTECHFRTEQLYDDSPIEPFVPRHEHPAHATAAELSLNLELIAKGVLDSFAKFSHCQ